jgi:hypothetical protein
MPGRRGHCPECRSRQCRQDPAQCRLVDRAGQAQLDPRGQLDLDYPIHPPIEFGGCRHRINRRCRQCQLFNRRRQSHWCKAGQLARAKPTPPGVKLAAADPVQPANQRGRGSRRNGMLSSLRPSSCSAIGAARSRRKPSATGDLPETMPRSPADYAGKSLSVAARFRRPGSTGLRVPSPGRGLGERFLCRRMPHATAGTVSATVSS